MEKKRLRISSECGGEVLVSTRMLLESTRSNRGGWGDCWYWGTGRRELDAPSIPTSTVDFPLLSQIRAQFLFRARIHIVQCISALLSQSRNPQTSKRSLPPPPSFVQISSPLSP